MEVNDLSWRDEAACAGMDTDLFIADGRGPRYAEAKAVCATCPVTTECASFAVQTGATFGIWGGRNVHQLRAWARAKAVAEDRTYSTPRAW